MVKVEMTNYGAVFNLHCPRCGNVEFSEEVYDSGKNKYHKCMHCGADVCSDTHTHVGIVIEPCFREFTQNTYDDIKETLKSPLWVIPEEMPQKDHSDW